jgi:dynein heavy chain
MIDPQSQANVWIKNFEAASNMRILRPTQSVNDLTNQLENSISFGVPVLLENVTESID